MKREVRREIKTEPESPSLESVGGTEESPRRYSPLRKTRIEGIDTNETEGRAFRGVEWADKAALFCFGLLATLALVVVMTALAAVMLLATTVPAPARRHGRVLSDRRANGHASGLSAPKKIENA